MPTFFPKLSTFENINQVISPPVFYPDSSSVEENRLHYLDILQCLKIYIDRTSEFRKTDNLFVQFVKRNKGFKASKSTLRRRVKEAIRLTCIFQEKDAPSFLRGHSTCAVSNSWEEKSLVPLNQICSVASWSSYSISINHYHLDLRCSEGVVLGWSVLNSAS